MGGRLYSDKCKCHIVAAIAGTIVCSFTRISFVSPFILVSLLYLLLCLIVCDTYQKQKWVKKKKTQTKEMTRVWVLLFYWPIVCHVRLLSATYLSSQLTNNSSVLAFSLWTDFCFKSVMMGLLATTTTKHWSQNYISI